MATPTEQVAPWSRGAPTSRTGTDAAIAVGAQGPSEPMAELAVSALRLGFSPRFVAVDEAHVARLAEVIHEVPPILVHAASLTVIDGAHRLRAHHLLGLPTIRAYLHHGSRRDAVALAVASNRHHGLPLSMAERRRAGQVLLEQFPERSDRWIAKLCGLSHATIATLRRASGDVGQATENPGRRVGSDGRSRPIDAADLRARIREAREADPGASIRAIAARTGAAASTVHSVLRNVANPQERRAPAGDDEAIGWFRLTDPGQDWAGWSKRLQHQAALAHECQRRAEFWAALGASLADAPSPPCAAPSLDSHRASADDP